MARVVTDSLPASSRAGSPLDTPVGACAKLAVIGDVHAHWGRLDSVLQQIAQERADAILLVGDIGSHDLSYARRRTPERDARYLASVEEVLRRCQDLSVPVRYVPGNHDLPELCFAGNLDGRLEEVVGVRVFGIGGAGPARFGFCYEWDEAQIAARAVPECELLLCHAPPARTRLDLVHDGVRHVGSEAIREHAQARAQVLVCGHIHEACGGEQIGGCLCLNAGGLGVPFGAAQVGFVLRDPKLAGGWAVEHLNLKSGERRRWERTPIS
ncbi:MAG: hypothetical protein RL277_1080 [Planctomycetota bacterium]|jgi:Icc-related predicted phosphoesterase